MIVTSPHSALSAHHDGTPAIQLRTSRPNFFTPNLLECESLVFLEVPPATLVAHLHCPTVIGSVCLSALPLLLISEADEHSDTRARTCKPPPSSRRAGLPTVPVPCKCVHSHMSEELTASAKPGHCLGALKQREETYQTKSAHVNCSYLTSLHPTVATAFRTMRNTQKQRKQKLTDLTNTCLIPPNYTEPQRLQSRLR